MSDFDDKEPLIHDDCPEKQGEGSKLEASNDPDKLLSFALKEVNKKLKKQGKNEIDELNFQSDLVIHCHKKSDGRRNAVSTTDATAGKVIFKHMTILYFDKGLKELMMIDD